MLAWTDDPAPNGRQYDALALRDSDKVEILFTYCREEKGVILAEGWQYLFDNFLVLEK